MKMPKFGFSCGPVLKTAHLLDDGKKRELWFYGFVIGQFGIGIMISRKVAK